MSRGADRSVDVTDGGLFKPLLVLSLPIVAAQVLHVGYNLADTYWVGRLGSEAIAALTYSWAIVFLMLSVGGGLTVAGTVLVAQHKGAGNLDRSSHVAGQTLSFVTIVAVALAISGWLLSPRLMWLVGAEPGSNAFEYAVSYTRIIFVGAIFMFWFFIFDALSRGWGDTRTPLYLMVVSVTLNVVLDPFLILGFDGNPVFGWVGAADLQTSLYGVTGFDGWGVEGAAIATVFSRGLAATAGLYLLFTGRVGLEPTVEDLWLRRETVATIVDIGAPTAVEQGFRSFGITVLTAVIALTGEDAVAAYGIATRLSSLLFMPALGLARGTETVVGQNLGANQPARAKRAVALSSAIIVATFVVLVTAAYPHAEAIAGFFIEGDESGQVIEYGAAFIVIAGPAYVLLGVFQIMLGGLRGSGSTRAAMVLSIQELWLWRIPIAVITIVVLGTSVVGVWYAIALSYVFSTVVTGIWVIRGNWTESVIEDPETDAHALTTAD